jgi:hypothetical protein
MLHLAFASKLQCHYLSAIVTLDFNYLHFNKAEITPER